MKLFAKKVEGGWELYRTRLCLGAPRAFVHDDLPFPLGRFIHLWDEGTDIARTATLTRYDVEHV